MDMKLLDEIIDTLRKGDKLDQRHRDHGLTGNWIGFRECHIKPDWLLVYSIDDEELELFLFRTGSHSDLF